MKKGMLQKVVACGLSLVLAGCTSKPTMQDANKKVVILKQLDHSSMDEIANAIQEELLTHDELVVEIESGQNDPSTLKQLVTNALETQTDVIVPIGSIAASICATSKDQLPVVFAAVSDPEKAELVDLENVSGTSDAINAASVLNMMQTLQPDLKKVGLLYCQSEANSAKPIANMKKLLDEKGIAYVEACGNTGDEIIQAATTLVSEKVDAVFTPTDNKVMASAPSVAKVFVDGKIPHYTGADSFVECGSFATCGVDYVELGKKTAQMAYERMMANEPFEDRIDVIEGSVMMVNKETAKAIGMDVKPLEGLGKLVMVETESDY